MFRFLLLVLLCVTSSANAQDRNLQIGRSAAGSEQRVALVIGNSAYKSSPLRNPVNDARAIAGALKQAGFDVTLKEDLNQRGLFEAAREFGNKLKEDGVALFYYAGHGMQVRDRNYLVPVEADIQSEDEIPYSSLDVNFVMDRMSRARSRMNLVILDACRNNPFSRSFRSAAVGLAQMDAPGGTLLAYATAPGKVASDGTGANGLYTQYLLKHLPTPGLPVEIVFKRVREDVEKETKSQQIPWESSSVKGDFYFVPPKPVAQVALAAPAPVVPAVDTAAQTELAFWDSIKGSSTAADYQAYLATYPNGRFAALARARIASIEQQGAAAADSREMAFWDSIKGSSNPAEYQAYLDQYPKGRFVAIARARVEQAKQDAAAASAAAVAAARPPAPAPAPATPAFSPESLDLAFWNSIQGTRVADDYRAYLRQYPSGRFAELAKLRVEQLSAPPPASAAPAAGAPTRPVAPATQLALAAPSTAVASGGSMLPLVNERWVYQYTDLWSPALKVPVAHTVIAVGKDEIVESLARVGRRGDEREQAMKPALSLQQLKVEGVSMLQLFPYARAMDLVKPGQRVAVSDLPQTLCGIPASSWSVTAEVEGEEDVTTPAGKFRALKVTVSGSAPRGQFGQQCFQFVVRTWFAPEIKRYVKTTFNTGTAGAARGGTEVRDMYELVEAPR